MNRSIRNTVIRNLLTAFVLACMFTGLLLWEVAVVNAAIGTALVWALMQVDAMLIRRRRQAVTA